MTRHFCRYRRCRSNEACMHAVRCLGDVPTGWIPAFVALALALLAVVSLAFGHEAGEPYADYYQGLTTNDGGSCCGGPGSYFHDCEPTEARIGPRGWEAKYHGHWLDIPPEIVRPVANPTGEPTLCVHRGEMVCFVPANET